MGSLDLGRVGNTGKRELSSEIFDFLLELLEGISGSTGSSDGRNKVLEEFRTGLCLGLEGDLYGTVKEVGNLDHLGLLHGSRSQSVGTDSNSSRNDGGLVTGY